MRALKLGTCAAVVLASGLFTSLLLSQEKKPQPAPEWGGNGITSSPAAASAAPPSPVAPPADGSGGSTRDPQLDDMAAWRVYATPGPEHQQLKDFFEGTWDTQVNSFVRAPEVSTGTTRNQMVVGGRYLQGKFEGTSMDQPLEGCGLTGFDNAKEKYFGTWIDSMGTGLTVTEGTFDPSTKTFTFEGEMTMPDGQTSHFHELIKIESKDKHLVEMFMIDKDGKENKIMEITYTRKK